MEKLITCSRVLYDKDISVKMKEITSLKKNLRRYEPPKIEYSSLIEWETKKKEAYQIIKNGLNKWIIEDAFEYEHMSYQGLTRKQQINIPHYIERAINLITKENNIEWAEKISHDIIHSISGFIHGFTNTPAPPPALRVWDLIYSQLDPEDMSNLIYNNIVWQLENDDDDGVLEEIPIFTCKMCGIRGNFINVDNICFDCETTDSFLTTY